MNLRRPASGGSEGRWLVNEWMNEWLSQKFITVFLLLWLIHLLWKFLLGSHFKIPEFELKCLTSGQNPKETFGLEMMVSLRVTITLRWPTENEASWNYITQCSRWSNKMSPANISTWIVTHSSCLGWDFSESLLKLNTCHGKASCQPSLTEK